MQISAEWATALVGLLTVLFGSGAVWQVRRRRASAPPPPSGDVTEPKPESHHDISTKAPKLSRVLKVSVGDYVDVHWGSRATRITIHGIGQETVTPEYRISPEQITMVDVEMSVGGALVFGGESTLKAGVNRFKLPQKQFDQEEPCSMYLYHIGDNYFRFQRVFVEHINQVAQVVTLNIFGFHD